MQLIILLLFHTRRIPGKNKSKRELQLIFIGYKYTENALVYFTPILVKIMCCAYLAMSQSLMVPNAEKTDRMSSSVRSRWMLARYNLKTRASNSQLQSRVNIFNQPVVTLRLSHNFINAGLGLGHLARPSHLKKEVITGNLSIFLKYCFSSFKHCIRILWYSCHRREFRSSGREQVVRLLVVRTPQRQSPAEGKLAFRRIIYLFVTSFSCLLTFPLDIESWIIEFWTLCLPVIASQLIVIERIGPNGRNAVFIESSLVS